MNKSFFPRRNNSTAAATVVELIVHLLTWGYIFFSPFLFRMDGEKLEINRYLHRMIFPMTLCFIFYINYLWLIPKLFLHHRYKSFLLANVLFFMLTLLVRQPLAELLPPPNYRPHFRPRAIPEWYFILKSILTYAFTAFIAVGISIAKQWKKAEDARQKAEIGLKDAELQNLKNQINPHFLLNTLNNIYSLTTFDSQKAQEAIIRLSKMLRYILYENNEHFVKIEKEIDFLQHYIELMRLRLPEEVVVDFSVDNHCGNVVKVAPLIFISLVENAFKHGISNASESFIRIKLECEKDSIIFSTLNSNHPKSSDDRAGSGIGLKLTANRLQLAYPDAFTWHYGVDKSGATYSSIIQIRTTTS